MSLHPVHTNEGELVPATRAASSEQDLVASRFRAMSNFEVASPLLLRATPANCPLRFFGAALRERTQWRPPSTGADQASDGNNSDDFHPWSRVVELINDFWSHSWHAPAWLKVVVLLLEYNGVAASTVGTVAVFVALMFRSTGVIDISCVLCGHFFFVTTLLCWPSGRHVFFDKICISQVNEKKKFEAVMSIGAFLKASKCMIILLDVTYPTRLWCMFEVAAYCKLMENNSEKVLRLKPLAYGTIFIFMFSSVAVMRLTKTFMGVAYALFIRRLFFAGMAFPWCHAWRVYWNDMEKLRGQLSEFSMDASKCFCCSVGHVNPDTGAQLSCDRKAVNTCVTAWFGSCEAFSAFVRHDLPDRIAGSGMSYEMVLMAGLPLLWHNMDLITPALLEAKHDAVVLTCVVAATFFLIWPLWVACISAIANKTRRQLSSRYADACLSLAVAFLGTLLGFIIRRMKHFAFTLSFVSFCGVVSILGLATSLAYGVRIPCRPFGAWIPSPPERGRSLEMTEL
eukprot:TRINITY_DN6516_c0_g2_i1.p1 TRINITY_DN6516_c0_g2~~TRINITY_DN6516_c0_g2_i1.p1  ORF type:complete len:511 (+),score=45.79 TRINITY_DN6516_c0_g2_i1:38-1570(+)